MRVLFDGYWWADGPMSNRTVQRELIQAWCDCFPQDEIVLASRKDAAIADVPAGVKVVRTSLWPHAISTRVEIPRLTRRANADIAVVHNYAPARVRSAVFIHDAMFVEHPEWFSRAERLYFAPMMRWARGATVVATSTQTEADRLKRVGRLSGAPLAMGLAVPTALTDATPRRPSTLDDVADFAVTVGRLNVRKNLERILAAAAVSERIDPQHPLLVVGTTDHSGKVTEYSENVRASLDDGTIRMIGGVSDAELAWLYSNASLALTLSLDEGFGLPAIEAAFFGAPLLVSDIAVFRETVGAYARFVPPRDSPQRIAAAIDDAWGAAPAPGAQEAVRDRYTWHGAVHTLRSALAQAR